MVAPALSRWTPITSSGLTRPSGYPSFIAASGERPRSFGFGAVLCSAGMLPDVLFLSSADTSQQRIGPRLWRKHLLRLSEWLHPNDPEKKLRVDLDLIRQLKANFDAGVLDFVPVPSKHTDDWEANKGETIALEVDEARGLYAIVRVDDETDRAIESKLLRGVSAGFDPHYVDKESGRHIGPVLKHVALTNVPYIKGLEGFERAVNLSAGDFPVVALSEVMLLDARPGASSTLRDVPPSSSEARVTIEEAKALLKKDGNIDVDALAEKAGRFDKHTKDIETAARVRDVLRGAGIALSDESEPTAVVTAVEDLKAKAAEAVTLSEKIVTMEKAEKHAAAERMVRPYLKAGKLDKAKGDEMIAFAETQPDLAKSVLASLSDNVLLDELGSEQDDDKGKPLPGVELSEAAAEKAAQEIIDRQRKTGAARTRVTAAA